MREGSGRDKKRGVVWIYEQTQLVEETQKKGEGQLTNQDNWSICPFF